MFDVYDYIEGNDLLEEILSALDRDQIENFLDADIDEYYENIEEFNVTKGMFPEEINKTRSVVRFNPSDIDDIVPYFRMLKLMINKMDSEDNLDTDVFGNTYTVLVEFSETQRYTLKLNKAKGCVISLETITCGELVAA